MSRRASWGDALGVLVVGAGLAGCSGADDLDVGAGPGAAVRERPDTPGSTLLFRYDPGDTVESFDSAGGHFRVHFTRGGDNAVAPADVDVSGVPDFVEEVAAVYEEVLAHYTGLGFRAPLSDETITDNGGDGRFDVYLLDFGGTGDGNFSKDECLPTNLEQCAGFITQENDFASYGYASSLVGNQTLGSHEFFHAVQAAYDTGQNSVIGEGTATWATETIYPALEDFDHQVRGYLDNPDRSLDEPMLGPTDPFSYGSAIFFRFLEQRHDIDLMRQLWERCENGAGGVADPSWFEALGPLLEEEASTTFAEAFFEFATWNLYTGTFADDLRAYADAGEWDSVHMQEVVAPQSIDPVRVQHAATRYFRVDPDERDELRAALVVPAGDEAELEGLEMLLAAEGSAGYTYVVHVEDPTAGTESVSLASANYLVVAVVNTLETGTAKEPALCIGSPAEVQACRSAIVGQGGTGGTGGTGGVGGGGGGAAADGTEVAADDDGGCGCRLAGPTEPSAAARWGWLAAVGWLGRRRRSRSGKVRTTARPRSRRACAR